MGLQSQLEEGIQEVLTAAEAAPAKFQAAPTKALQAWGRRESWPPGGGHQTRSPQQEMQSGPALLKSGKSSQHPARALGPGWLRSGGGAHGVARKAKGPYDYDYQ